MRIMIVAASPKKSFSSSLYFSRVLKFWLMGHQTHVVNLKSVKDYNGIVEKLPEMDALVFAFPIYVDAIPSSLLGHLQKLEHDIKDKGLKCRVYGIANCGFYEGRQCGPSLKMLGNWSSRANLPWGGGIGVGAGEMVGVIRLVIPITVLISILVTTIVMAAQGVLTSFGAFFNGLSAWDFIIPVIIYVAFSFGLFSGINRLRNSIVKKKVCPETYRTVTCCPRFLFVFFANLFWYIKAAFNGVPPWKIKTKIVQE